LTKLREEQTSLKLATKYDQKCRFLSDEEIIEKLEAGENYTVRLKVPKLQDIVFEDIIK
jgi:nondiscriminating glutamyl-tRNA synthetase